MLDAHLDDGSSPPPLKNNYYEPEDKLARLTFRVQDRGIAAYGPVFTLLEDQLAQLQSQHPKFELELSGRAVGRCAISSDRGRSGRQLGWRSHYHFGVAGSGLSFAAIGLDRLCAEHLSVGRYGGHVGFIQATAGTG